MLDMLSTLISVIIGGIIALVPSIISARTAKENRLHELRMKRIELYEAERIAALTEFLKCFGAMTSSELSQEFDVDRYMAASQKAAAFVSPSTRAIIIEANEYVSKHWDRRAPENAQLQINMASAFFDELSKQFDIGNTGNNKDGHKQKN